MCHDVPEGKWVAQAFPVRCVHSFSLFAREGAPVYDSARLVALLVKGVVVA